MIVTEVHVAQGGCPPVGIVSNLTTQTHLILHHGGERWEIVAATRTGTQGFFPYDGAEDTSLFLPIEVEGDLTRKMQQAMKRSLPATISY
jgi:hypothetical protein